MVTVSFRTPDEEAWLSKVGEGQFELVSDKSKAWVFPSEAAANSAIHAPGRHVRNPEYWRIHSV